MYQTGETVAEIYKCSVILKAFYSACYDASNFDSGNLSFSFLSCFFLENLACREYETVICFIYIDDFDFNICLLYTSDAADD